MKPCPFLCLVLLALAQTSAFASALPAPDADVPTLESYPCTLEDLERLKRTGELTLPGVDGAPLALTLTGYRTDDGVEQLRVRVGAYTGTITRRGDVFFSTLPTRLGTLRLESAGGATRLIDERWLAYRNAPGLADYRHVR